MIDGVHKTSINYKLLCFCPNKKMWWFKTSRQASVVYKYIYIHIHIHDILHRGTRMYNRSKRPPRQHRSSWAHEPPWRSPSHWAAHRVAPRRCLKRVWRWYHRNMTGPGSSSSWTCDRYLTYVYIYIYTCICMYIYISYSSNLETVGSDTHWFSMSLRFAQDCSSQGS